MSQFAIAAIGQDQPGIVGAVTTALFSHEFSLDDTAMTILGDQFAMLITVHGEGTADQLQMILSPVADTFSLLVEVRAVPDANSAADATDTEPAAWSIAAHGPDKPGLVAHLASELATCCVNITDFGSRVGSSHAFLMWFTVSPTDATPEDWQARLSHVADLHGLALRCTALDVTGL